MLGKLLKYEWRGLRLPFLIMLVVLAGTTTLTCGVIFTINPKFDETIVGNQSIFPPFIETVLRCVFVFDTLY